MIIKFLINTRIFHGSISNREQFQFLKEKLFMLDKDDYHAYKSMSRHHHQEMEIQFLVEANSYFW